jgi:hypothetical protein
MKHLPKKLIDVSDLITPARAAEMLNITPQRFYARAQRFGLPRVLVGERPYHRRSEVLLMPTPVLGRPRKERSASPTAEASATPSIVK